MKRCFVIVGVMVLLLSCATMPVPEGEGNSLVIGSFILDFPDGFFNLSSRKFDMNVKLQFRNVTQDKSFTIYTTRGYFYFLTNGTDKYVLERFSLGETRIGDGTYTFGGETLNFEISTTPNKVIYLGHIVFTEAGSTAAKRSGSSTLYDFEPSVSVDWNKDLLYQYINYEQEDSPWLKYELVEYAKP